MRADMGVCGSDPSSTGEAVFSTAKQRTNYLERAPLRVHVCYDNIQPMHHEFSIQNIGDRNFYFFVQNVLLSHLFMQTSTTAKGRGQTLNCDELRLLFVYFSLDSRYLLLLRPNKIRRVKSGRISTVVCVCARAQHTAVETMYKHKMSQLTDSDVEILRHDTD